MESGGGWRFDDDIDVISTKKYCSNGHHDDDVDD